MTDKLLALIRGELIILGNVFKSVIVGITGVNSSLKTLSDEVKRQKPPVVNVEAPKVNVNVPDVIVPDIKIPEIKLPEIIIPEIKVPEPKVTVNVPPVKIPEIKVPEFKKPNITVLPAKVKVNIPDEIEIKGLRLFSKDLMGFLKEKIVDVWKDVDVDNPIPVVLVDKEGKTYSAETSVIGGGGGGPDVVGIKNEDSNGDSFRVNVATEAKQDDIITAINSNNSTVFANNEIVEDSGNTYVCKERSSGEWYIMKIDANSVFTHATITNNPTVTSYIDARAAVLTLTYGIYNNAF